LKQTDENITAPPSKTPLIKSLSSANDVAQVTASHRKNTHLICNSCFADDSTQIAALKRSFWQKSGSMCKKHLILSIKQGRLKILPPVYLALLQAEFEVNDAVGAADAICVMRFAAGQAYS